MQRFVFKVTQALKQLVLFFGNVISFFTSNEIHYQPYFSIDLETTGLPEENCSILELAIVYNDGKESSPHEMPYLKIIIDNGDDLNWNEYARELNKRIVKDIDHFRKYGSSRETRVVSLELGRKLFDGFVRDCLKINDLKIDQKSDRVSIAGKNAAGFDLPLLKTFGFNLKHFNHRVIDPGPMYYTDFGRVPNLGEIKKKYSKHFENTVVTHDAYDDAIDVIIAIDIKKKERLI